MRGHGNQPFGTAQNQFYQDWWSNGWNSRWDSDCKKLSDGDVPEWDGKTHRTIYFREIDLWSASTGVPPGLRAIRLLQKLTGQAFDKLEHVSPDEIRNPNGIARYKELIENVMNLLKTTVWTR